MQCGDAEENRDNVSSLNNFFQLSSTAWLPYSAWMRSQPSFSHFHRILSYEPWAWLSVPVSTTSRILQSSCISANGYLRAALTRYDLKVKHCQSMTAMACNWQNHNGTSDHRVNQHLIYGVHRVRPFQLPYHMQPTPNICIRCGDHDITGGHHGTRPINNFPR